MHRTIGLWLLYFEPLHEPTVLLCHDPTNFISCPRLLVFTMLQTLIQKNDAIPPPVKTFNSVPASATKQEQGVGEGFKLKLLLHQCRKPIYTFSEVGVPTGDVDLVGPRKIVQHHFSYPGRWLPLLPDRRRNRNPRQHCPDANRRHDFRRRLHDLGRRQFDKAGIIGGAVRFQLKLLLFHQRFKYLLLPT